jgi:hypothetical protein
VLREQDFGFVKMLCELLKSFIYFYKNLARNWLPVFVEIAFGSTFELKTCHARFTLSARPVPP